MFLLSERILGTSITAALLKASFFGHFCAGETATDILPTIDSVCQRLVRPQSINQSINQSITMVQQLA
jgi:hypothetical protein